ncbi:hypothetical protein Metal_0469 [Methylomicrobium album BG8]|uniref:Uncharacterized protein n=1 Tax=Methylomicrobium album BG8 TaxID=686340 RepID=H8GN91_METAL|nr:hypothetical protein Metal_0469 [Methylomicrobium album BG8]
MSGTKSACPTYTTLDRTRKTIVQPRRSGNGFIVARRPCGDHASEYGTGLKPCHFSRHGKCRARKARARPTRLWTEPEKQLFNRVARRPCGDHASEYGAGLKPCHFSRHGKCRARKARARPTRLDRTRKTIVQPRRSGNGFIVARRPCGGHASEYGAGLKPRRFSRHGKCRARKARARPTRLDRTRKTIVQPRRSGNGFIVARRPCGDHASEYGAGLKPCHFSRHGKCRARKARARPTRLHDSGQNQKNNCSTA